MLGERFNAELPGLDISFADQEGRSDEDAHAEGILQEVETADQAEKFLKDTFSDINYATIGKREGSCGIAVAVTKDGFLTIANLGDSQATLFLIKGEEVSHEVINTLHNPNVESEEKRLQNFAVSYGKGENFYFSNNYHSRIGFRGCGIAVSRAFGDNFFVNFGLSHEPELYKIDLSKYEGQDKLVLELTCDGTYEGRENKNHSEWIKEKKENLAHHINSEARKNGSTDDLTTYVIIIDLNQIKYLQGAVIFSVFDGHGGYDVSEKACNILEDKLADLELKNYSTKDSRAEEEKRQKVEKTIAFGVSNVLAIKAAIDDKVSLVTEEDLAKEQHNKSAQGTAFEWQGSEEDERTVEHDSKKPIVVSEEDLRKTFQTSAGKKAEDKAQKSDLYKFLSDICSAINNHKYLLASAVVLCVGLVLDSRNGFKYGAKAASQITNLFNSASQSLSR